MRARFLRSLIDAVAWVFISPSRAYRRRERRRRERYLDSLRGTTMAKPDREIQEAASELERILQAARRRDGCEPTELEARRLEELTRRILNSPPSEADVQAIDALSNNHALMDRLRSEMEARVRTHPNRSLEGFIRCRTTMEDRRADELLWRLLDDPAADSNVQMDRLEHEFFQIRPLPDRHARRLAEFVLDSAVKGDTQLADAALFALRCGSRSRIPEVLEVILRGGDARADALLAVLAATHTNMFEKSEVAEWITRNFPGEHEPRVSLRRQAIARQLDC